MTRRQRATIDPGGLGEIVLRVDWQADAACRGVDPDLFFPTVETDPTPALALCAGCPVRIRCLGFAIAVNERYGIWGGVTEQERRKLGRDERERIVRRAAARAA